MVRAIGVITGGGDCPGLNAAIRAVVRSGTALGYRVYGIRNGWLGVVENNMVELTDSSVSGIISRGGTILGTSRVDPVKHHGNPEKIRQTLTSCGMCALVVIGGDGTIRAAHELSDLTVPLVCIPKTIDNDVYGTDITIGFDTAVSIVTEALDRLRTTAESHHRIMVVEVMGRNAGWIALAAGMAGGADEFLIPEIRVSMEDICTNLKSRYAAGKKFSIVVVAEGTRHEDIVGVSVPACDRDECGHEKFVGIGNVLGKEIEHRLGIETRVTVLGHVQRGGSPTAFDRVLATRLGIAAVDAVHAGNYGCMVGLAGNRIQLIALDKVVSHTKGVGAADYKSARRVVGKS
jgi:6-phosphofructokinase 1